jgi:hypothetical protein
MMKNYQFTIIASGLDAEADDFEDRFIDAGCDDATIAFQKGVIIVEFDREAKNFLHAITSAFDNVQKAGAKVVRFEPDHLVSLSDIAERSGLTKAAISLYSKGARGTDFPSPVARFTSSTPLWDWVSVSNWMHKHDQLSAEVVLEARMMREANRLAMTQDTITASELSERLKHEGVEA